jgi:hypothetical protein
VGIAGGAPSLAFLARPSIDADRHARRLAADFIFFSFRRALAQDFCGCTNENGPGRHIRGRSHRFCGKTVGSILTDQNVMLQLSIRPVSIDARSRTRSFQVPFKASLDRFRFTVLLMLSAEPPERLWML